MLVVPFSTLPSPCPYLKDRNSRMEYRYVDGCDFAVNDALARRGFRRFGKYFSKPNCAGCRECVNIRVDALNFKFSKSARRTIRKNENTKIILTKPLIDDAHVALYKKYHKFMQQKREWKYYELDFRRYYELYVAGHAEFGKEIAYFADGRLIGVDLVDILSDDLSIGRYSLYQQILLARQLNLRWIYLGYYVKDCPSLAYKADYKPYERLREYVPLDETPVWEKAE